MTASALAAADPFVPVSIADLVRAAWTSDYLQTLDLPTRLTDDEVVTLWERHMREPLGPHLFDDGSDRKQAYRKRGDEIITNYLMRRLVAAA